jgi:pyrrolysine biosynthesis protein PylD
MTRLRTEDINNIEKTLQEYDQELIKKTGCTLKEIAIKAVQAEEKEINEKIKNIKTAVVPITTGKGIINKFSETVTAIVKHMGVEAFKTENTDEKGLSEAFQKNADIILSADDNKYTAVNRKNKKVSDNAAATAKGFVTALKLMVKKLEYKEVLIIGAGRVGKNAAYELIKHKANIAVYDKDQKKSNELFEEIKNKFNVQIKIERELNLALYKYNILFDASPKSEYIRKEHINMNTYIAAPGMPLAVNKEVLENAKKRLIHDPLQLGTAVMIMEALL